MAETLQIAYRTRIFNVLLGTLFLSFFDTPFRRRFGSLFGRLLEQHGYQGGAKECQESLGEVSHFAPFFGNPCARGPEARSPPWGSGACIRALRPGVHINIDTLVTLKPGATPVQQ